MTRQQPVTVRVVSFNIRNGRAFDGWNWWPLRRRSTAAVLRQLRPDVAGLQEVFRFQQRYLVRALDHYGAVGEGRSDDRRGERCPVLYRLGTTAVAGHRTQWYSDDPDQPGTRLPGASFPRIATMVELVHRRSGARYGVANTHFDERRADNRLRSAELLLSWLDRGQPWLVVGDLNAGPDDAVLDRFEAAGYRSALAGATGGTAHGFTGRRDGHRNDHILLGPGWDAERGEVSYRRPHGRLPSDHWPVVADLRLLP